MQKSIKKIHKELQNGIDIQCSKGNYDQSEYMRGIANGMLWTKSLFDEKKPKYKEYKEEK